ncbi:MAG: RidA family protein [Myxococcales bacterium]|nr:RidA family protein [Myxococcota bacterium]MDW8283807.1 RidA family protein [Myxococcales bacterium]
MDGHAVIHTPQAPAAIGPYSQAISVPATGRLIFCSGQIALCPQTGQLVGAGDVRQQTEQVLSNLCAVLQAAGAEPRHVVKTTIFLQDLADFAAVNEVYARTFAQAPPARSTVQAAALPRGALVEIEAVALVP